MRHVHHVLLVQWRKERDVVTRISQAVLVLVLAVPVSGCQGGGGSSSPRAAEEVGRTDATTLAALGEAALGEAKRYGDESPSDARVVQTTRKALTELVAGGQLPFEDPVFAVVLHGDFTSTGPRPHGA
jgi:hypothetical protein